jgi:hypothetical protein
MPLSDRYVEPEAIEPIELDEINFTEELAALKASWPVRTDGLAAEAPEDRFYALVAAAKSMIAELEEERYPAPLTAPLLTAPQLADIGPPALVRTITGIGPPVLARTITDIGPCPGLERSTNAQERLPPDLRDRFWAADAEEKAELLATLSPIESSFPDLPPLSPITAEEVEEMLRAMR